MSIRQLIIAFTLLLCAAASAVAQEYNQMDEAGNITRRNENGNFNKHNNDTTSNDKDVPKGIYVWTVDRRFGDITPAQVDTLPHLFQNTVTGNGVYKQYNTTGNNYTVRQNRVAADRPLFRQFIFTQPYDFVIKEPDQLHFTNTLSPITNITYDECGDKQNGEDHIDAKFAVNAGKRLGLGFDINYAYARGYFSNQNTSHFGFTLYSSYLGDRYQMHAMLSTYNQKVAENGGLTDDAYITLPESFSDDFAPNEIPTVLEQNWNRNKHQHLFLTHRYNVGFYRLVPRTEEEIKARKFAAESKKENEERKAEADSGAGGRKPRQKSSDRAGEPMGRPEGALIMGDAPELKKDSTAIDSTRIRMDQAAMDSIAAEKARQDSIDTYMKKEFVPVTSFIHTLDINSNERIYQAYQSPNNYYANTYFDRLSTNTYSGDSIYDQTKFTQIRNTLAVAMLEGFNKWAKAGLKLFASYDMRRYKLPAVIDEEASLSALESTSENSISVGAQISKTQGKTLHYNLTGETWLAGDDAGQLKLDFTTDLNFRLLGDTLTLAAKAAFYRLEPTFYLRHYHSKHFWWDNDLSKETRTRVEGLLAYKKTKTKLRLAIEEIQNYTYFGMSYDATTEGRTAMTAAVRQNGSNINLMTAQLYQDFRLGPLNWENIITYQNSNSDALPVPDLNIFTNLYLKFMIVKELAVEFGASATWFTKYYAPDYCPQIGQFAVQENEASRVELGGYPFIDVYANFHLKRTRFFLNYTHANAGSGNRMQFLVPHYAQNNTVLRFGLSWNFFN